MQAIYEKQRAAATVAAVNNKKKESKKKKVVVEKSKNVTKIDFRVGDDLRYCNGAYHGLVFEMNIKQHDVWLVGLQFRSFLEDTTDGKLYIRKGFHANDADIEIDQFEPVHVSEKYGENEQKCYAFRAMSLVEEYYLEAGETYTLLIHSSQDDYFLYYSNAQEGELANEVAYENNYFSLNTGFYVTNEFERVDGVRKFCGILSVDVDKNVTF